MFALIVIAALLIQTPAAGPSGPVMRLTATTENVTGAPDPIRIDLVRWSTDAERDQLLNAWTMPGAAAARGDAEGGARGGRGGRGGGRGAAADAPPATPEASLTAALGKLPTVGYVWSSETAGYSLHFATRIAQPDGSERIILITDRRLGAWNNLWRPSGNAASSNYEFSLIELHLNARGEGEGKASLTGKITADTAAKIIALENYAALPVVLKGVKRAR
jgi:hypothetical protein